MGDLSHGGLGVPDEEGLSVALLGHSGVPHSQLLPG
jgi:hypothetical protein